MCTGLAGTAGDRRSSLHRGKIKNTGEKVAVHWSRQHDAGEVEHSAGVYYGVVTKLQPTIVKFTHEQCPECMAPRSMEALSLRVPMARCLYFDIRKEKRPTEGECVCLPADPTEGEPYEHGTGLGDSEIAALSKEGSCVQHAIHVDGTKQLRGNVGATWHLFKGKPAFVHELVWRRLAATTRAQHQKWLHCIREMPADLQMRPLGSAIVELILRMGKARRWCWATVSSALGACASALAALTLYSSERNDIDIRKDTYFSAAVRHAQHLARVTSGTKALSVGMSFDQFKNLTGSKGIKSPKPRLLLMLAWHFAARVGDMRQVRPCDIVVKHEEIRQGAIPVTVTFRFGKGAAWWGPYTIHAVLPQRAARDLMAALRLGKADEPLFLLGDQAALAAEVGKLRGDAGYLNLRSIRRGAIMYASKCGVPDDELRLLSGHRREDTLMRYLGWGASSASKRSAAIRRHEAHSVRGGESPILRDVLPPLAQPPKMGRFSGFTGRKGKRVAAQPRFFPLKPPSAEECGVMADERDIGQYQLHIKATSRVHFPSVLAPLLDAGKKAQKMV